MSVLQTSNPLHLERPRGSDVLYEGRFRYVEQPSLGLVDFGSVNLCLTRSYLWLSDELAIPIGAITQMEVAERGFLPKRIALRVVYRNPVTHEHESVAFAKIGFLGLSFKREPLQQMKALLEELQKQCTDEPHAGVAAEPENVERGCEACGARPAYYPTYFFTITALAVAYRSKERRRVHCRRCVLRHGLPCYLVTMLLGWPGIGILAYPIVLYRAAQTLEPAIGRYYLALAGVPLLIAAGFILRLMNVL